MAFKGGHWGHLLEEGAVKEADPKDRDSRTLRGPLLSQQLPALC